MNVLVGTQDRVVGREGWAAEFSQVIRRDMALYAIIAAYAVVMLIVSTWLKRPYWRIPMARYMSLYLSLAGLVCCAGVGGRLIGDLRTRSREAPASPIAVARAWLTPGRAGGLLLYVFLAIFMGAFTTLKTLLPEINPFWFDPWAAALDRMAHGGGDPWRLLHGLLARPWVTQAIEVLYLPVWMLLTGAFPLVIALRRRDEALRTQYLLAFLSAWIVNGTVLAGVFMSGGPVFYAGLTGDSERYRDLVAYLSFDAASPISAAAQQASLWSSYLGRSAGLAAGISAFPSMHVTMAVLIACAAWRMSRPAGLVLVAYVGVIVVGSVHLGWHYAIGSYFAVVSSLALWWAMGRAAHVLSRTRLTSREAGAAGSSSDAG